MRVLVLGGTAWLGASIAASAAARGAEVVCLARGSAPAPAGIRFVAADRDAPDAYDHVAEGQWDAVIDVARHPGHVRGAAAALAPLTSRYLFVSSGNVYADHSIVGADESASLRPPLEGDVMPSMEQYGEAKSACEKAVLDAFGPDRALIARAGLIAGPGDSSGRTGYWPWRFAHPSGDGDAVLAPATDLLTEVIDVRDLASWLVESAEEGRSGVFNAGGLVLPYDAHLAAAAAAAGHLHGWTSASDSWLSEQGVAEWSGPRSLPLWLADAEWRGFNARDSSSAAAHGLRRRPLEDTLRDGLAWEERQPVHPHGAGLTDDEERALLADLGPPPRAGRTST